MFPFVYSLTALQLYPECIFKVKWEGITNFALLSVLIFFKKYICYKTKCPFKWLLEQLTGLLNDEHICVERYYRITVFVESYN